MQLFDKSIIPVILTLVLLEYIMYQYRGGIILKKKISLALGIMVILILIQGIAFFVILNQVDNSSKTAYNASEMSSGIKEIKAKHYSWIQELTLAIYTDKEFKGSLDSKSCSLGEWIRADSASDIKDEKIRNWISELDEPHNIIHDTAGDIVNNLSNNNQIEAIDMYTSTVVPNMEKTINILDNISEHAGEIVHEKEQTTASLFNISKIILAVMILLGVVAGIILKISLTKSIIPPLKKITKAANDLSKGNIDIDVKIEKKDELGELATAFAEMTRGIKDQARILVDISEGDYTEQVSPRSDNDTISIAINRLLDRNNQMLVQLKKMSDRVAYGADHFAISSQSLASGSAEQTSSVQRLTESANQIHEMAIESSDIVKQSVKEVEDAVDIMSKCRLSMHELKETMEEIQSSSFEIEKVINVIDDIAFQTNILALNAAVEAARAGQHGKGFSVVADEVRELANKSAKSAKETASLIKNNLDGVEKGPRIAQKADEMLNKVGMIAIENSKTLSTMNEAADGQKEALKNINSGMSQITSVIESNSASAEESAANAQELTAQSKMLKNIVSQFKLRGESK